MTVVNDRAAELDMMDEREAIASLEHEFPGWRIYRAADRLCHAVQSGACVHVLGEDWVDLRDSLVVERGRIER